jgi:hypothetical protein
MLESGDAWERAGRFDVAALRVDGGLPATGDADRFFSETRLLVILVLQLLGVLIILADCVRKTYQKFLSIPLRMVSFGTVLIVSDHVV